MITVVVVGEVLAILVAMALSNLVFVVICGVLGGCYCGASDASSFVIIVMPGFMRSVVMASEPGVGRRGVACRGVRRRYVDGKVVRPSVMATVLACGGVRDVDDRGDECALMIHAHSSCRLSRRTGCLFVK